MDWADRIPKPPLDDVVRGALGELSEGYLHQLYYSYPLRGGYAAIMGSWAAGVAPERLATGAAVMQIGPTADGVTVETMDRTWRFGQVVVDAPATGRWWTSSTTCRTTVAAAVRPADGEPDGLRHARASSAKTRTSSPPSTSPTRTTWSTAWLSPRGLRSHNAPPGHFSVQAEITAPRGLTGPGAVRRRHRRPRAGRPAPRAVAAPRGRRARLHLRRALRPGLRRLHPGLRARRGDRRRWFEAHGITLHGRFGSHQYLNVDGCLEQSIGLARPPRRRPPGRRGPRPVRRTRQRSPHDREDHDAYDDVAVVMITRNEEGAIEKVVHDALAALPGARSS